MGDEENVKVAVRVRPFNKREVARNASLIVEMKGATTCLKNPDEPNSEPKKFTFDYSYWSHDGCKGDAEGYFGPDPKHPNGKQFADQRRVFNDLGMGVLNNAWSGYNSTLFAYGQTGSGKSWSVVGYGINKGIVPQFCETVFKGIDEKKSGGEVECEVTFSMLEIYMEEVRDLLNPAKKKGGLRIRQHPKKGFYAEALRVAPVGSYVDIEGKIEEGTTNRTVASTNMNATSSRAHTVVGITLIQKFKNAAGEATTKSSVVNLVDLAGSERAESTGATGDRLKEGAAINQSLSSLGNCIAALADRSSGKDVKVPYRDSVLTKLLKNALGGNSRTIMIAAISPADINYDETLGTLRYADRAKQIKTKATVNEDPTDKLIRELQEENDKLKKMLESGGVVVPKGSGEDGIEENDDMTQAEKNELKKELEEEYAAQLAENDKEMEEMKIAFEEKLKAAHEAGGSTAQSQKESHEKRKNTPHILNLNLDPQLSGKILHFLDAEAKKVGNGKKEGLADIALRGPSVQDQHATFSVEGGNIYVEKCNATARVLQNGEPITHKTQLHHNDRLLFGTTQLYLLCNPKERDSSKEKYPEITFDSAQEEIAANSGFDMNTENKSRDDMLLQEDLMEMLPAVEEANSISEELDKKKKFELMLVSPEARGQLKGRTEVMVRVTDLETDLEWVWPRQMFFNRKFVMQEMFDKFEDGEDWERPADSDPFSDPPDAEIHVGSVKIWLQSLAYNIELKEQLEITDFKGQEVGLLNTDIVPCNKKGKEYTEKDDMWVDSPSDLVGKDVHFMVKVTGARGLPSRFTDVYAKYLMYLDEEFTQTKHIKDTSNPDWGFKKQHDFSPATEQFVKYLSEGAIIVQIWGKQKPPKAKKTVNTRDTLQKQSLSKGLATSTNSGAKMVDAQKVKYAMELAVVKKRAEKAEAKVAHFRELLRLAEQYEKSRISTKLLRDLLHAPTQDAAEKCLKLVPKEKGADQEGSPATSRGPSPAPSEQKKDGADDSKKSSTCVLL